MGATAMTDTSEQRSASSAETSDSDYLRQFGVEPRLKRALGFFTGALFAIAFQGPTTGALLVSGATLAIGGPAFIWAIPIIFLFQFVLSLLWAELSSHYPLTGGIFQWAGQLGGRFAGWMTGLFYTVAIILVMPAVGLVMNVVLSGIFPGMPVTPTSIVITAMIFIVIAGLIMATSVTFVARINSIGVVLELVVLLGAAIALLFHRHQPISVLATTGGVEGSGSYLVPFLVVVALVVTQLVGFETAGAFAEETKDSRIKPSQAIIAGLAGTALILFIFDFCMILSLPDVKTAMGAGGELIPQLLNSQLGSGFAKVFLVGACVSVASTGIATLATIVRCIYGMARNNQLPGARALTKLSPRTEEPNVAIVVSVVLSMIPLLFIKKIEVIVAAITALIIIPYLIVLVSLLMRRLRGWPNTPSKFNLGRWGMALTIIGIVWSTFVILDAAWSRDATNPHLGPLPIIWELAVGIIVVGVLWWFVRLRNVRNIGPDAPGSDAPATPTA